MGKESNVLPPKLKNFFKERGGGKTGRTKLGENEGENEISEKGGNKAP